MSSTETTIIHRMSTGLVVEYLRTTGPRGLSRPNYVETAPTPIHNVK